MGFRVALLLFVASFFPAASLLDDPDPFLLERLLPEETLLYVSIPQTSAVSDQFRNSTLHTLIHDEEIQAFLDPIQAYWLKKKTRGTGPGDEPWNTVCKTWVGLTLDELWDMAQGPIAFALLDLPISEDHSMDLAWSIGASDVEKFTTAAATFTESLQKKEGGISRSSYQFKNKTIHELRSKNGLGGGRDFTLYYTAHEKSVLFATTQARVESLIEAAPKSLAGSSRFRKSREKISAENTHLFLAYLNVKDTLKRFRRELGDQLDKSLDALGLKQIDSAGLALAYDGAQIRERCFIATSAPAKGLIKLLAGKPHEDRLSKWVPAGALSYAHSAFDWVEAYDVLTEAVKALDPEGFAQFETGREKYEQRSGYSIRNDLLASFGTSWTSYSAFPESGGFYPDTVVLAEMKAPQKFEDAVTKLCASMGLRLETLDFHGKKIRFLWIDPASQAPSQQAVPGFSLMMPFSLPIVFTLQENTLILGFDPQAVKRHLAHREKTAFASIAQDPAFTAAANPLGKEADAFSYMDYGRLFALVYNLLEPIAQFARGFPRDSNGELMVDLARLPMGQTLSKYIGTSHTVKRTHEDGISLESRSSIGLSPVTATFFLGTWTGTTYLFFLRMSNTQPPMVAVGAIAANELATARTLAAIVQAQQIFKRSDADKNGVQDFWTRDVAGLYALKDRSGNPIFFIDPATAQADPEGCKNYPVFQGGGMPKNGYFLTALTRDQDGDLYIQDPDGDGNRWTHKGRFGIAAYPATYGMTGRNSFIVNEGGKFFKKDTAGKPVDSMPKDPAKEGWQPYE